MELTKQCVQLNDDGYFVGMAIADLEPIAKETYLLPGNCVFSEPPEIREGEVARFIDGAWVYENDLRGKTAYSTETKQDEIIDYVGELKAGYTLLIPNSEFETWNGAAWVDNRTAEEIAEYERSLLPALTKRQFSLYLYDIGKYDEVINAINANPRFKIEFETVATIERNSPTVSAMGQILEWNDLTIDEKWKEAIEI